MWEYRYTDDLYHAFDQRKDHKYIARVKSKNSKYNWRYFYTKDAYNAYLKGEKKSDDVVELAGKEEDNNLVETSAKAKVMDAIASAGSSFISGFFNGEMSLSTSNAEKEAVDEYNKSHPEVKSFSELARKPSVTTGEEDRSQINTDYNKTLYNLTRQYAWSNNCAHCTAAYELRRRGYDVEAAPAYYTTANTIDEIKSWYKDPQPKTAMFDNSSAKASAMLVEKDLLKQGNGARGQMCMYWRGGGGHSVAYEVKNNKVYLVDCQTNQTLKTEEYFQYASGCVYFRTDNLELSDNILKTVRNKKRK